MSHIERDNNLAADEDGRGSFMSLRVSVEGKVIIAPVRTCKGVPWRSGQRLKSLGHLWRRAENQKYQPQHQP